MPPSNIDLTSPEPSTPSIRSTSATTSQSSSLPNAFGRMMEKQKGPEMVIRDQCMRPTLEYNTNYNPYAIPRDDLPGGYSPYVFKEPLFDDRPAIVARLPKKCTLAPPAKRPRTSWVWPLGYAIHDNSKPQKPVLMWHCKLCK
jgi:hypothetical protein